MAEHVERKVEGAVATITLARQRAFFQVIA